MSESIETELTAPAELMAAVIESFRTAIVVKNMDGLVVAWNHAAEELFGYRKDEIIGRHGSVLSAPGQEGELAEIIAKVSKGELISDHKSARLCKDQTIVPVAVCISPVRNNRGELIGVASMMRRSQYTNSQERFRLVVEAAPNGMAMVDSNGMIVLVNSQTEKMFGYSREELIGQPIEMLVPERYRAAHPGHRNQYMHGASVRPMGMGRELFALSKDGSEIPVEIGLNPISAEGSKFVLASIIDISERKRAEELVKARDEAISVSKVKSAFIANISHELRTPLSSIIGMNDLFLQSELSPEQKEMADAIREASQSLLNIVNDILDLARIEAGKLVLKQAPLSVIETLQQCVRVLSRAAQAKKLKLFTQIDQSIPGTLIGDAERIRQVIINLIGNAIKFTDSGEVIVSVSMEDEDADKVWLRFSVKDSGIGISSEQLSSLFKPFVQLEMSGTKTFGGTGLGLSICKNVVETLGGEIMAESTPQVGSTFYFTVPLMKAKTIEKAASASCPGAFLVGVDSNALSVLVVEDNNLLQLVARKLLEKEGMNVTIARTGLEALDQALNGEFDLILMDLNIPEINGIEVTRRIREAESKTGKRTPIIAMTAAAMKGDLERCLDAGMDEYLSKPVNMDDLKEKLKQVLHRD